MAFLQLSLLHIPAIVVHGNSLSMEVWGHWFTPAHVLGGWSHRLSARRAEDAMRELVGRAAEPVPGDADPVVAVAVATDVASIAEPCSTPDSVADLPAIAEDGEVAVLDPVQVEVDTAGLADLFDDAVAVRPRTQPFLELVDQMTLF